METNDHKIETTVQLLIRSMEPLVALNEQSLMKRHILSTRVKFFLMLVKTLALHKKNWQNVLG